MPPRRRTFIWLENKLRHLHLGGLLLGYISKNSTLILTHYQERTCPSIPEVLFGTLLFSDAKVYKRVGFYRSM